MSDPTFMAFKQKKQLRSTRSRQLKPGAVPLRRQSRVTARSCTYVYKKRITSVSKSPEMVVLQQCDDSVSSSTPAVSPSRSDSELVEEIKPQCVPRTPKTPESSYANSESRLEALPKDILVKVLCYLHHDQLKAVFHVSRRIRNAVLLARQSYFNYTTPDRSRQEMLRTKTPLPTGQWPFISKGEGEGAQGSILHTPKAPKHGPRPPRLHPVDMRQVAAVLFQESSLSSKPAVPPGLPKPSPKPVASTRALFHEEELCQAVAQNKLL